MSKPPLVVIIPVIIAALAIVAITLSHNSFNPSQAPDFTLPTMAGANITLSELEGSPVVLNFWSISCGWCRYQLPFLENLARQSGAQVKVIAVNIVDSATNVREFFRDYEPTMIVALDGSREVFVNYCQKYNNSRGFIPFTLLVDKEGMVQYTKTGAFASEAELRDTLEDVLGITMP